MLAHSCADGFAFTFANFMAGYFGMAIVTWAVFWWWDRRR